MTKQESALLGIPEGAAPEDIEARLSQLAAAESRAAELEGQLKAAGGLTGLPSGLDPEGVRKRRDALIAAGTEPSIALRFAIDAEMQQQIVDQRIAAGSASKPQA